MPLPTNNSRPSLPYKQKQSLPNDQRFDLLGTRPPTAAMFDAEFNAIIDQINILADAINKVQAGSISGSDAQENADKVLKTDGEGNLSWVKVTDQEMDDGSVTTRVLSDQSVTTDKMGDGAITHEKLAQGSVTTNQILDANVTTVKIAENAIITSKIPDLAITTPKLGHQAVTQGQLADAAVGTPQLIDANVTTAKIADAAVTTQKLADATVTNPKIGLLAVTAPQMSSAGSQLGQVLTSDGNNNAIFQQITTASLANNAVTFEKLVQDLQQLLPFALLCCDANGTILKQKNIAAVTMAVSGEYSVRFTSAATDVNYIVGGSVVTPSSSSSAVSINIKEKTQQGLVVYTSRYNTNLGGFAFSLVVFGW